MSMMGRCRWIAGPLLVAVSTVVASTTIGSTIAAGTPQNVRLAIDVGPGGRFTLGAFPDPATGEPIADTSWNLMFGWGSSPWSSGSTVRVDGSDSFLEEGTVLEAPHAIDASTNRGSWKIGEIQVTQVLQIVGNNATGEQDTAEISYVLTNTGATAHTVGLRMMVDTQVDSNDGAKFRLPGVGPVTEEREYTGAAIPATFEVFKAVTDPVHVASGRTNTGSVPPDRFVVAAWRGIYSTKYDYAIDPTQSIAGDSAYALFWDNRALAPGASLSVASAYGLGQISADVNPPIALGLDGPTRLQFLNGSYTPNPFPITATVQNISAVNQSNAQVTLTLPAGIVLADPAATPATRVIGTLTPGQETPVSWLVKATPQQFDLTVPYSASLSSTDNPTKSVVRNITLPGVPALYHPLPPSRILDTRAGVGAPAGAVGADRSIDVKIAGIGSVPADARSVALNVTAVGPTADGYMTVYPTGATPPAASNLNYFAGDVVANLVIAKVGANGSVSFYNNSGATHVVADVAGYFSDPASGAGDLQHGLLPTRQLDTRIGLGAPKAPIGPIGTINVKLAGVGAVPDFATSVILNLTAVGPTGANGYLTVFPAGTTRPNASNVNFNPGDTVPNLVIAKIGANGSISIYNDAGATDVLADVMGYFSSPTNEPGAGQKGTVPDRMLDTRTGIGGPIAPVGPGATVNVRIAGIRGIPDDATSVVLNVTAVGPTAPGGYLTVYPTGEARPNSSNLNFNPGDVVPNLVIAKVGAGGSISIFNAVGNTNVLVDVMGYFA